MDKQEIFDTVTRHLFTQGRPAKGPDGICFYRTDDGLKCAVGCLIPDDLYDPKMDNPDPISNAGTGIVPLMDRGFTLPDWFGPNLELLADLQSVHDVWYGDPRELEKSLYNTADNWGLKTSVVDEEYKIYR